MLSQAQRGVIAVLLFLAFWLAWVSPALLSYTPITNSNRAPDAAESENHRQDVVNRWMTPDSLLAIFTLGLVFVGCFQVGLFYVQLRLIGESLRDAKKAADAAESTATAALLQARAAIGADRSDLIVSQISLVPFPESDQSNQNTPMLNGMIQRNEFRVVVYFTNSGRTRSRMSELCIEWTIVPRPNDRNADPPQVPIYENRVGTNHIFAADQTIAIKWLAGNNSLIRLTQEQQAEINSNAAWLWIYGAFVYTDFMDETYDAGFVAHWEAVAGGTKGPQPLPSPRGIVLEGPPAYIYRLKREQRGERAN
jgi:hypothetical protein